MGPRNFLLASPLSKSLWALEGNHWQIHLLQALFHQPPHTSERAPPSQHSVLISSQPQMEFLALCIIGAPVLLHCLSCCWTSLLSCSRQSPDATANPVSLTLTHILCILGGISHALLLSPAQSCLLPLNLFWVCVFAWPNEWPSTCPLCLTSSFHCTSI